MKIAVIHDYADVFRGTRAYAKLADHEVRIFTDAYADPARVVEQVSGCDALLLTQQRVPITRQIVEKLPQLKFISQTGRNVSHLDLAACTEHGILVSAGGHGGGSPYSTTGELAWALILASLRHLPYEIERFKQGHWHSTAGTRLYGHTLGVYALGYKLALVVKLFSRRPLYQVWSAQMYEAAQEPDAPVTFGKVFTRILAVYVGVGLALCLVSGEVVSVFTGAADGCAAHSPANMTRGSARCGIS